MARLLLPLSLLILLLVLAPAHVHAATSTLAPARPPNILLIVSDDHAWTDYGFMQHPHVQTPRLDRLAASSLTFTRGYVPASLCCPSLASLITGLFPHQHGIVCNDPPLPAGMTKAQFYRTDLFRQGREQMSRFLEQVPTLPRLLQARSYLSLQTGKWWQNHYSRGGFTHGMTGGEAAQNGRHGDAGLDIGRKTLDPIYQFIDHAVSNDRPFLVWYAPMMPHDPHTPPDRLLDKYRPVAPSLHIARYWAMIEWFDETCGAILDHLTLRNQHTNTIVVYLADNGWIQSPDNPRFAPKSKQSPYDGGLRTPILVHWPNHIRPQQIASPVSSIDILPTLLAVTHVESPPDLPGTSLLDLPRIRRRNAAQGACFTHDAVDLNHPASGLRWRWIVADQWKLIVPDPRNQPTDLIELYHLAADPHETLNLAPNHPARTRRLLRRLDQWWNPPPQSEAR